MNKEKTNQSTSTDLDCSKTIKKRTKPTCRRCERHGDKDVPLKGHKRACKYQNCDCWICYEVVAEQKQSAENIAFKRSIENDKRKLAPNEILPTPWIYRPLKKYSFHRLINFIMEHIHRSGYTVLNNPEMMWWILSRLYRCACDMEVGIKNKTALDFYADIMQAIYGYPMIYSQACCYLSPSTIMAKVGSPNAGQLVDIKYPLPNSTSASSFPENSFEPPTEPPTKRFKSSTEPFTESSTDSSTSPSTESSICPLASSFPENSFEPLTEPPTKRFKSSTEPSTEPSTYPSTESSKYNYRSIADNQWSKSMKETCRIPKKIASPTK